MEQILVNRTVLRQRGSGFAYGMLSPTATLNHRWLSVAETIGD